MGLYDRGFVLLLRWASGDQSVETDAIAHMKSGMREYFRHGGRRPLEKCMKLPPRTAMGKFAMEERDLWLRLAALTIEPTRLKGRTQILVDELTRFLGFVWPKWRGMHEPPADASSLYSRLFRAVRACPEGFPTSSKHIGRVVDAPHPEGPNAHYAQECARILDEAALDDWIQHESFRREFSSLSVYQAFTRAMASGRVKYADTNRARRVQKVVF